MLSSNTINEKEEDNNVDLYLHFAYNEKSYASNLLPLIYTSYTFNFIGGGDLILAWGIRSRGIVPDRDKGLDS
jgi:hypothetical protein